MNVINELTSLLGPVYEPLRYFGGIGMFGAPILAFLAIKGAFTQNLDNVGSAARILRALGSAASVLAGLLWLGALFSIFPGILFCSVYCFLGLALPVLGLGTGAACLLLLLGTVLPTKGASNVA
jgi:hypothetical protein